MPSDIGYALPPSSQRPQILNRVDTTESRPLIRAEEENTLEKSGVELKQVQVVTQAREVLDDRFPSESSVERFRGNTQGRSLDPSSSGESIARLPSRVQAFDVNFARSGQISSFNVAEAAALGAVPPSASVSQDSSLNSAPFTAYNPAVPTDLNSSADTQFSSTEEAEVELPSINGSGEISARFEQIAEQIALRSEDEFTQLRPGGEESERVSLERSRAEGVQESISDEQRVARQNQDLVRLFRNQEQTRQDERVSSRQSEQLVSEGQVAEAVREAEVVEQESSQESRAENPQPREPGAPTNSSGEPLSSEEQQEVQRLAKRDREVRAHEQAHARAGGANIRGGVQLSYETGPDGKRYAVDGEVNIDLSSAQSPRQTISKMRQVQSAALAPANPSGADRAVAALAARRELDARAQVAEESREERERLAQAQASGAPASIEREDQKASGVEQRESSDHIAGAQSVIPDPSFSPKTSGIEQQSLDFAYGSSFPLSAPAETSRPVVAPSPDTNIKESSETPTSPRAEGESPRQEEVASLAIDRGWHG